MNFHYLHRSTERIKVLSACAVSLLDIWPKTHGSATILKSGEVNNTDYLVMMSRAETRDFENFEKGQTAIQVNQK